MTNVLTGHRRPSTEMASPIALFTYNRPEHTAKTLAALARNGRASSSDLTVFCDGPKHGEDRANVERVRSIARETKGFRSIRVIERSENMGLARSVIAGVSHMLREHATVIVVEDDMTTSPHFLTFMNDGLARYAEESRVISVCGYAPPSSRPRPDSYFLPGAHCWGWATWRRGWALFEPNAATLLDGILKRDLIYTFDWRGAESLTRLLQRSAQGDSGIDSWALRWMASAILHGKFTLYPGASLLVNNGFDGTGTHRTTTSALATVLTDRPLDVLETPILTNVEALEQVRRSLIRWRCQSSRRERAYYAVAKVLPSGIEQRLYCAIVRRAIRRATVQTPAEGGWQRSTAAESTPTTRASARRSAIARVLGRGLSTTNVP
jgi:hypothetical protein